MSQFARFSNFRKNGMFQSRCLTGILLLAFAAILGACQVADKDAVLRQNETEVNFAKTFLDKLREKDFGFVKQHLSGELVPQVNDALLAKMAGMLPSGKLLSVDVLNAVQGQPADSWKINIDFEYHYTDGWALEQVAVRHVGDEMLVTGIHVAPARASQKQINGLNLEGKSGMHYAVFIAVILVVTFTLVTLVVCLLTPIKKRKWLWAIWVLCGVCGVSINWTNGQLALLFIAINIPGASATSFGPLAPWIVSVYFPVGAVMFWSRRKAMIRDATGVTRER